MNDLLKPYDGRFTDNDRRKMFGNTLKAVRLQQKLTQRQIAEALNVSSPTYCTYEKGKSEPNYEILVRLSYILHCPLDLLLQRDNIVGDSKNIAGMINEIDETIDSLTIKIGTDEEMVNALNIPKEFTEVLKKKKS